jgi:signal transduction histidine kinase/methylmalonyl-CoA mutase cobalamin-binding subunit
MSVAILLAATGVALYVFVPPQMQGRAEEALALRARSTAQYLVESARDGVVRRSRTRTQEAAEMARLERDLVYAVVVGERGEVLASAFPAIETNSKWEDAVGAFEGQDLEEVTAAVVQNDWVAATVFVGLSRGALEAGMDTDRRLVAGFSIFLILLALGTFIGVYQMERLRNTAVEWQQRHKSVRLQAGSLYSSVKEHRQNEKSLKKSESKYKSLFESTMASAMADLEELNSHLEKRKSDLEHEVGVRKKAEVELRQYTARLQLLNAVERSLLEGKSVEDSAELALNLAIGLVSATRMTLVESDLSRGAAWIVGMRSDVLQGSKVGDEVPFSTVQIAELVHCVDLDVKQNLSEREKGLLAEGIKSYVDIPMVVRDEVVGVLCMQSQKVNAFSDQHFSIGRDVADLLAIGVHRSRLDGERELYEKELVLARDRAEDMARLKTAFLTNMSHEIRTPISGIMGFSQVLHDEVDPGLQEFTSLIRESAHRLLNTINSVLELARLESGKDGIEVSRVDLSGQVRDLVTSLEPLARRKSLSLRFEDPGHAVWCELDTACVERIVTNLVDNGVKFTDGGGVRVSVSHQDGRAMLTVEDTGVGIAADFLPRLFDDFRQENMDANREHEGSGLGLTVTKKLVDRLGGRIAIQSEKGVGTIVYVDFPLADQFDEEGRPAKKVLMVSAGADAAEYLATLGGADFDISVVPTPKEGVIAATDGDWDAVIVDVNAGAPHEIEEAARRMGRKLGSNRILAIATQIIPRDPERLLEAGFSQFIDEPFQPGNLTLALVEAVSSGPVMGDAAETAPAATATPAPAATATPAPSTPATPASSVDSELPLDLPTFDEQERRVAAKAPDRPASGSVARGTASQSKGNPEAGAAA